MKSMRILPFLFIIIIIGNTIMSQDVESILNKMTIEEKIDFIGGYKSFFIRGYNKYKIPQIRMADGPVGVRNYGKATAFPAGICLAATFNRQLAYNTGKSIALEAKSKDVHILLGPGVNIYRLPLCGRNFEYFGEDPYLTSQMAKEYILGMQNEGVVATIKHYAANNQEYARHTVSSDMDERTLHEIYLPAFKTAVEEAKVAAVMTSYNLINGIHASQHDYLINTILKKTWNFEGFVMSDWVSTYDALGAAKAGLDLEMPSGSFMNKDNLIPAIKKGELDESIIDDKVRRILNIYKRFNFFDSPVPSKNFSYDENFSRTSALNVAREGIVLLKNKNGFLPVNKNNTKTIAVIGPNANPAVTGGGGSSFVDPLHPVSLLEAVKLLAGNDIEIIYEPGVQAGITIPKGIFDNQPFYFYNKNGEKTKGVEAEFFKGMKLEGEPILTTTLPYLSHKKEQLWDLPNVPNKYFSARFVTYFTPEKSSNYIIAASGDDGYRVYLDGEKIIDMWQDQGETPSISTTFLNAGQEYQIIVEYYQHDGGAVIRLGAEELVEEIKPEELPARAIAAAKKADFVIFSAGFSKKTEGEGRDRSFELPYDQSNLISKIAEINDNTVVVLNAGGNVDMTEWIDKVPALLMAWYPGQEGNLAVAEIIFGNTNPSGKLPASFAYKIEENPAYRNYFDNDGDLRVKYEEGIFLGYRYWDKSKGKPRFPFGFGLSYTSFEYSGLSTDKETYSPEETVHLELKIKNTGKMDGKEAVQIYVSDEKSSLPRPYKELKDFTKVHLRRGEEKIVKFSLNKSAFSYYDPEVHDWKLEPGIFYILAGSSSADIMVSKKIEIK